MKNEKFLHQFFVVAERESISEAAEELFMSQSALTKNVKKVEERLGVELFERLPRGVALTQYGEILYKRVKKMELEFSYALHEISSVQNGVNIKLRIGAGIVWGDLILPHILGKFHKKFPQAELEIIGGSVNELAPKLLKGKLDIILGSMDYQFQEVDNMVKLPLTGISHVIVCNENHPLLLKGTIKPSNLIDYNWITYHQKANNRNKVNDFFDRYSLPQARVILNTTYLSDAVAMLKTSNNLMCIPDLLASKLQDAGVKKLPFFESIWDMQTGAWMTQSSYDLPAMKEFITLLQEQLDN